MLENVAASAYNAALAYIKDKVRHSFPYISTLRLIITPHFTQAYLAAAASIFGVESRQASFVSGVPLASNPWNTAYEVSFFPSFLSLPCSPLTHTDPSFNEPNTHPHIPLHPTMSRLQRRPPPRLSPSLPTTKRRHAPDPLPTHRPYLRTTRTATWRRRRIIRRVDIWDGSRCYSG